MKTYRIGKYDARRDEWLDYGPLPIEDIKSIVKGYKRMTEDDASGELEKRLISGWNTDDVAGMYTKNNVKSFFTVTETEI